MQLELSADQAVLHETTAKFLDDKMPLTTVRQLRGDAAGFDSTYWRRGAELGWTSLLVRDEHGGGSLTGGGVADLCLVAHEFGAHAAPGPLVPTNLVAAALSDTGADTHAAALAGLLDGSVIASWCYGEPPPGDGLGRVALQIRVDGGDVVIDGAKRPVESATEADHLLVVGHTGAGLTQVLVPAGTAGVTIEPLRSIDLTRRFSTVRFDNVRLPLAAAVGAVGEAAAQIERQLQIASVLLAAESVGAMQTAFAMTVEWAFDRYSFGRPLASYQALKHRFADMKTWLEGAHAITDDAAIAVDTGAPDAGEISSAAKAFVGEFGPELAHDCVQMHGGIGVTFEHDLHLFLRRITLDAALHGTAGEHRRRVIQLAGGREEAQ